MASIKKLVKVTVLDFEGNLYYAQNGENGSSVRNSGFLLLRTCFSALRKSKFL